MIPSLSQFRASGVGLAILCGMASALSAQTVTLASPATPSSGTPGITTVTLTGTGFPTTGNVTAAATSITLEPATTGAGLTATTTATAVTVVAGSTRRISFLIPQSLAVKTATPYLISVTGSTSASVAFSSSNKSAISLIAAPALLSANPASGPAGQAVAVVLTGQLSSFLQGATQASFGAGTTVGGGPAGDYGPVLVVSPTIAIAVLRVSPDAVAGSRSVSVKTGAEQLALAGGFTVTGVGTTPAPTVLTLASPPSPATGLPGITTVSITGSNFPADTLVAGQINVLLEPATAGSAPTVTTVASSVTAVSGGSRTISFVIPAALSVAGPTPYLVSLYGSSSSYGTSGTGFTFAGGNQVSLTVGQAAALTSVSPATAVQGATAAITLTGIGTHFVQGTTQASFGLGISVGGKASGAFGPVTVLSPTSATAQIVLDASAPPGTRTVQVATGAETLALTAAFSVQAATPSPVLTSVAPSSGAQGQAVAVTISGANTSFGAASTVSAGADITVSNILAQSATSITALFTLSANAAIGTRNVTVVTGSQTATLAGGFSVRASVPAPSISLVTPASGAQGQSLAISITGLNTSFAPNVTTVSLGTGITVSSVAVTSPTTLTAQVLITGNAAPGARNVTVTTGAQIVTATAGFQVTGNTLLLSVAPNSGQPGQNVLVTITGQNTSFGATTTLNPGAGITATNLTVVSATVLTAVFAIDPAAALGARNVSATTGSQVAQLANAFTVISVPSILSVAPATGAPGQTLTVTVTGQNTSFGASTSLSLGADITVTNVSAVSATVLTAQLTIGVGAAPGSRTASATTGTQTASLTSAFTVQNAAPQISVSPSIGQPGQTVAVTITGQNTSFAQTTTVGAGAGIAVQNVAIASSTSLTAQLVIDAAAVAGPRTVVVTTGLQVVSSTGGFTVGAPAVPSLTSITPSTAQPSQAVQVTIVGQNTSFGAGTTVTAGTGITVTSVNVASPTSLTAQFSILASAVTGNRNVSVTSGTQTVTLFNGFTIQAGGQPIITSVSPNTGQPGQSVQIAVTGQGTNFTNASTLDVGSGITVSGVTITSPTTLTAKLSISSAALIGTRALTVTTDTEVDTLAAGFIVQQGSTPTISAITPATGAQGDTFPVTITGQNTTFDNTSAVSLGSGITVSAISSASATQLSFTIAIDVGASVGTRDVTVTKGAQTLTLSGGFSVTSPASLSSLTPNFALQGGLQSVTVVGLNTKFVDGSTTADFGPGVTINSVTVADSLDAVVKVTVAPGAATGFRNATLTTNGQSATLSNGFNVLGPGPQISISSPSNQALFSTAAITVTGTVSDPQSVITVNGKAASVSGGTFSASNVVLKEGSNLLTASAVNQNGIASSAVSSVLLDTTPPIIHIDNPSDGATLMSTSIRLSGMVNDIVSGTVNSNQVSVKVNGVDATVSNRTFQVDGLLLVKGQNTIVATATDKAGNSGTTTITVNVQPSASQQTLNIISGNGQTGAIGSSLPAPFVVQLLDSNGNAVAGRPVTFTVRRGDGVLLGGVLNAQTVTLNSDAKGFVQTSFKLGSRVGTGMDQVQATAAGFAGETVFIATTTAGPAVTMQNTNAMATVPVGIAGKPLSMPSGVIVFDAGANPVANVVVTFTVQQGGGNINGQTTVTVNTDSDGKASALLTLGLQEGIANNVMTASFAGSTEAPLSFQASAVAEGMASTTSVSGVVLDNANKAIPGATAKIVGSALQAKTDKDGRFTIPGAPLGTITLIVDGSTSSRPERFPFLAFQLQIIAGQDNTLGMPIFLPIIDQANSQTVGGSQPVTLTMAGVPGVAFTVAPNSATFPDGSHIGQMTLSQVHADKVPMPPAYGTAPRVVWTLQPAGTKFNPPIQVQLPNTDNLAPGQVVEIFQFDHDLEQFVSVGMARTSADGATITTDPGFGITKSGWGHPAPPPPPKKCVSNCKSPNKCMTGSCVNGSCVFKPTNEGGKCDDGTNCGAGLCKAGACVFSTKAKDGTTCDPKTKCIENAKCKDGACKGDPVDTKTWKDNAALAADVKLPKDITSKINGLLNAIPGLGSIKLKEARVGAKGQVKDCCDDQVGKVTDGLQMGSGTFQLTAELRNTPIPFLSTPTISKVFDFTFVEVDVDFALGVTVNTNIRFSVEGGIRRDLCKKEDCLFGEGNVSLDLDPKLGIEAIACVSTYWTTKQCAGITLSPIGARISIVAGLKYNKPTCQDGLKGFATLGRVVLRAEASLDIPANPQRLVFQYELFKGVQLFGDGGSDHQ